ncbi:YwmB family TATA-box binding protein [Pontibacillus litoralis]|uniref:TATA-box binding protein n=1 Tax=Pontibacillus litoralis JSM 072002 TaxID=1385512 RepID=A0A0A5G029_9BACI|nr:YwmB family TATA-box binding protein [Pontibacillus litoralis]KGX86436.1 hypothetical protein N784_04595 [Pontibacillus litoralis JSM 072002]
MKHFSILLLVFLLMQPQLLIAEQSEANEDIKPLRNAVQFLEEQNISLSEWNVSAKMEIKAEEVPEYVEQIKALFDDSVISKEEDDKVSKIMISNRHKKKPFDEGFIVNQSKIKGAYAEITYISSGKTFDSSVQHALIARIKELKSTILEEDITIFTCTKAAYNGMIDGVLLLDKFFDQFDVTDLQTLNEEDFITVAGYTSQWKTVLPYEDGSMNVQFAVRNGLGAKTTITIGTPIITSEY